MTEPTVRRRPSPWQWIRYSFGARLPAGLRAWVLHDTTSRTWWLRHVLRSLLQMSPLIAAVLIFIPGPFWIRGMSALGGGLMGLIYAIGYMTETTEHRLYKAGYALGTGEAIREERSRRERTQATALRREKIAARAARRSR